MSKKIHVTVSDATFDWLKSESERTSVSVSELARRALERIYPLDGRRTTGVEVRLGIWRRRIFGRRSGVAFDP
jgi:hypothetical protein